MEHTLEYLKRSERTKKIIIIAVRLGLFILAIVVVIKIAGWAKEWRTNRQWIAVNNLTPERLIARCGQPVEDKTKEVFPIIEREMSYKSHVQGTAVLSFSRTAEEQSDWVFVEMKDAQGEVKYDTEEAKITAMPCLDSRR